MPQQARAARSVTDEAHATLEARAVGTMQVAAKAVLANPSSPATALARALWGDHGAYQGAASDAVSYVDQLAALSPIPLPTDAAPAVASRAQIAPRLIERLTAAETVARAANRNFARSAGLRHDDPQVKAHLHKLLAVQTSRVAHDAAVGAWREASRARMVQLAEVIGWRRVAEPTACGACLALMDGSLHPAEEEMVVHSRDRCLAEPVVRHVNDERWGHPTGEEIFRAKTRADQDALFAGRGGAAKAQLIRSGAIDFGDLAQIATQRLGNTPIALAETPLSALQAPDA